MRYLRLEMENFRGVQRQAVDFSSGVTVIAGPNEAGKSSIREAIYLLRNVKDSSQKKDIKSVVPVGQDVGPRVLLELETGPYVITYEKQWVKRKKTELTVRSADGQDRYTSDEAHARFLELLEETADTTLLDQVDVIQGTSLDQARLANITALHRALGEVPEDSVADELMDTLQQELSRFYTPTGTPTRELRRAAEHLEAKKAELDDALEQQEQVEGYVEQLEDNDRAVAELSEWLQESVGRLRELEKKAQAVADLRDRERELQGRLEQTQKATTAARETLEDRKAKDAQIAQLKADKTGVDDALQAVEQDLAAAERAQEESAQRLTEAKHAREAAKRDAAQADRAFGALRLSQELSELEDRLNRAEEASTALSEQQAALAANSVTEEVLQRVVDADGEVKLAVARQEAAATHLSLRPLGETVVTLNGEELPAGQEQELSVVEALSVEVPGVLSLTVTPNAETSKLDAAVERTLEARNDTLAEADCRSVEAARKRAAERVGIQKAVEMAIQKRDDALGAETLDSLRERVARTKGKAQQGGTTGADSADLGQLEAAAQAAADALTQAETRLAEAAEAAEEATQKRDGLREQKAAQQIEVGKLQVGLELRSQTLQEEREVQPDEALDALVRKGQTEGEELLEALKALKESLRVADAERPEEHLANLKAGITTRAAEKKAAEDRSIRLAALIESKAETGTYDRVQEAASSFQEAEAGYGRVASRAEATRLLWETLTKHKEEAQARYVAPFRDKLTEMGRMVFGPDFQVQVTPDLEVESRSLGGAFVPFEDLSAGAREQIALLGRLSTAGLVDQQGGAPVILDDTLGYADPKRLEDLNVLLNSAGQSSQIIILTCQPSRFANIGGATRINL